MQSANPSFLSRAIGGLLGLAMLLMAGCATVHNPDPLESLNRKTFALNERVDSAVMAPVARAYVRVVPAPVRTGVGNMFSNTKDLWSAVNLGLQGRPVDGASDVLRFGTNTVFGVLGIFDVATRLGLEKHGEDFGQTLGVWGIEPGAYLVLPLLGPSSLRETASFPLDAMGTVSLSGSDVALGNTLTALKLADGRARLLPATDMVDQVALDKYLFVRDAYLQRRKHLVDNQKPPQQLQEEEAP
ncbi:MlaA family lipoprotein [Polaromonas aquatica]|uniref:MlaA family lipoprotein n=1 Tax=Polaromonas aquatica TaxID=332657 RepID=UPI003D6531F9